MLLFLMIQYLLPSAVGSLSSELSFSLENTFISSSGVQTRGIVGATKPYRSGGRMYSWVGVQTSHSTFSDKPENSPR